MAHLSRISASVPSAAGGAVGARRRPRAVVVVALLSILEGTVALAVGLVMLGGWWGMLSLSADAVVAIRLEVAALWTLSGAALLAAALGLLLLYRWAWTLAMATQCLTLTVTLYEYLSNDPDPLVMALGVLAVLLLNRQEVRLAFETPT